MTNFLKRNHRASTAKPLMLVMLKSNAKRAMMIVMLLCAGKSAHAEEWYSLAEDSAGKTAQPAMQLERLSIRAEHRKTLPAEHGIHAVDPGRTFFKPKEEDKIEIKKVLEKETETFKLKDAVPAIGFKSGTVDIPESYVEKLRTVSK